MALDTITLVAGGPHNGDAPFIDVFTIVGDGDYRTGGTAGFAALLQAKTKDGRVPYAVLPLALNGGYEVIYDKVNDKLLVVVKSSGVEVADHSNLSGTTFSLLIFSK